MKKIFAVIILSLVYSSIFGETIEEGLPFNIDTLKVNDIVRYGGREWKCFDIWEVRDSLDTNHTEISKISIITWFDDAKSAREYKGDLWKCIDEKYGKCYGQYELFERIILSGCLVNCVMTINIIDGMLLMKQNSDYHKQMEEERKQKRMNKIIDEI